MVLVDSERDTWNPDTRDRPTPHTSDAASWSSTPTATGRHGPGHGIGRAPGTLGAGGRGRGPRRDLPGPAGREHWPGRLLLLLREQDHHHGRGAWSRPTTPRWRASVAGLDHAFSDERTFWHKYVGFNYRMTNMQAAVGLAQVERLDEFGPIRARTPPVLCAAQDPRSPCRSAPPRTSTGGTAWSSRTPGSPGTSCGAGWPGAGSRSGVLHSHPPAADLL